MEGLEDGCSSGNVVEVVEVEVGSKVEIVCSDAWGLCNIEIDVDDTAVDSVWRVDVSGVIVDGLEDDCGSETVVKPEAVVDV